MAVDSYCIMNALELVWISEVGCGAVFSFSAILHWIKDPVNGVTYTSPNFSPYI